MARNGSGTYSLPAGNPVVTGTTISSTWANNTLSDIATALTASVANDGQTPIVADMDFDNHNVSNIAVLTATNLAAQDVTVAGNLRASGSAQRFQADFSNATITNRYSFASTTVNGGTHIQALPNGTATDASFLAFNTATPTNSGYITIFIDNAATHLRTAHSGSGTTLPLSFDVNAVSAGTLNLDTSWTFATDASFNGRVFSPVGVAGQAKNLAASANGTSANVSVTADTVMLEVSGITYTTRSVSLTINSAGSGANGLDTGSIAASTWYSIWVIYNPTTGTTAGLLSLSATAPTMPAGYTYKARVGWTRTDGTANKYPLSFTQKGNRVQYVVAAAGNLTALPIMASGSVGSVAVPTWVAIATGNYVPSTAETIRVIAVGGNNTSLQIILAPNNSYGSVSSTSNPPPLTTSSSGTGNAPNTASDFDLESTNIYWASNNGNAAVACLGWLDNI